MVGGVVAGRRIRVRPAIDELSRPERFLIGSCRAVGITSEANSRNSM